MAAIIVSLLALLVFSANVFVRSRSVVQLREPTASFRTLMTPPSPPSPTVTPTPSPLPRPRAAAPETIECVGPDGVHFQTTRKACDDLNAFWKNPNATPTPTSGFKREKVGEHTTVTWLPPDDHMSTDEELFLAVNNYRRAHGIAQVARSDTLCAIAKKRAQEQQALGTIDGHAGFAKYAQGQQEFSYLTEVLFGGDQPQSGVHIVEYGWDQSLTGHREAIQDRSMTHGCGGVAGFFAVFIFGMK